MIEGLVDVGRDVRLAYQRLGDADGTPVVLVAGLGQQMHSWPDGLCRLLVERGHPVLRFDNRDVGESTHCSFPPPSPLGFLRKRWHPLSTDSAIWPPTPSACSTRSTWPPRTWSVCRWVA
ncbi:hypothetical protein [Nocardia xishanensis]|uniref:hypothetical protein n=1 Tax=Nocardia xishanensis TaxID=238964 RepID=UPI00342893A3